ncbi:MAG TPA: hypothetical protein VD838_05855 [Anaeromyxobacteraceae bacterium]|nr:hypothetical protein [Anaeromyxobacteraceae bacterium]
MSERPKVDASGCSGVAGIAIASIAAGHLWGEPVGWLVLGLLLFVDAIR